MAGLDLQVSGGRDRSAGRPPYFISDLGMDALTWDREHLWRFRAKLLDVTDGDTVVVLTDNGMRGRHDTSVRVAGLWEPELSTDEGLVARAVLIQELQPWLQLSALRKEWPLRVVTRQLVTKVGEVTSFERYVGDVYLVDVNEELRDLKELMAPRVAWRREHRGHVED